MSVHHQISCNSWVLYDSQGFDYIMIHGNHIILRYCGNPNHPKNFPDFWVVKAPSPIRGAWVISGMAARKPSPDMSVDLWGGNSLVVHICSWRCRPHIWCWFVWLQSLTLWKAFWLCCSLTGVQLFVQHSLRVVKWFIVFHVFQQLMDAIRCKWVLYV